MVDPSYVCRICLKGDVSTCDDIFIKTKFKKPTYSLMMSTLFSLPISQGDGLPSKLCTKCRIKLISAYNLKLLAEKSYNTFKNLVEKCDTDDKINEEYLLESEEKILDAAFDNDRSINQNVQLNEVEKVEEIKNEIDSEVFGDSIIKQEYLEVVFDVSGSNKDEGVDDHLEDDRSLGYEDEDDTPLNLLNCDSEKHENNAVDEKQTVKTRKKTDSIKVGKTKRAAKQKKKKLKLDSDKKKPKQHRSVVCEICGKHTLNINQHIRTHSTNGLPEKYPCGECYKVFHTLSGRRRHMNNTHLGKQYYCELCKKSFSGKSSHILHCHTEKLYKCEICNKNFPTQQMLKYHIVGHTKNEPSYCDVCGKMFKTKKECSRHRRRVHDKEKTHACHLCPKSFFAVDNLKIHLRSHRHEKTYKCNDCDKFFKTLNILRIHQRRHAGVKNYNCVICSKSFVDSGSLKIHMISHTKEKNHPCRYCDMKFGRTDHRNRHERTAHLNKLNTTQLHKKNITDSISNEQS